MVPGPVAAMAVPLVSACPGQQTMGYGGTPLDMLSQWDTCEVQEKADMTQMITAAIGIEIDMANKYKVLGPSGDEGFFIVENTDFCKRQMKRGSCADCVGWDADVLYTYGGRNDKFMTMHRETTFTCCCFNRPEVQISDAETGRLIGSIQDPFACCDLTFKIKNADGEDALFAKGGCCQWGLCCPLPCGPCSTVEFDVVDAGSGDSVGSITKTVPSCLKFLAPGASVDNYSINFDKVSHPEWKAMLFILSVFIDFRYFSETQDPSEIGDDGLIGMMS